MLRGRLEDQAFPFREALLAIKLNPDSNLLSVASIALCLILLGFFIAGWQNLGHLVQMVRSEAEITVYMEDRAGEEEIGSAAAMLASQPGVLEVNRVTKEQALARMRDLLGKEADILEAFEGVNPFAAYLEVRVVPEYATVVAETAAHFPGVEMVRENREVLARLVSLSRAMVWVGVAVAAATGTAAMVIISHIVRLGIHARREKIETLRLLGATEWLVQAPFVAEGAILGGFGGLAFHPVHGGGVPFNICSPRPFPAFYSPGTLEGGAGSADAGPWPVGPRLRNTGQYPGGKACYLRP